MVKEPRYLLLKDKQLTLSAFWAVNLIFPFDVRRDIPLERAQVGADLRQLSNKVRVFVAMSIGVGVPDRSLQGLFSGKMHRRVYFQLTQNPVKGFDTRVLGRDCAKFIYDPNQRQVIMVNNALIDRHCLSPLNTHPISPA